MKKALYIFIIVLFWMPIISSAKEVNGLQMGKLQQTEVNNPSWKELLETLLDTDDRSYVISLISRKLEQKDSCGELGKLSWGLIDSALEKSRAISLFERIIEEKWKQTEYGEIIRIAGNQDDDQTRLNYLKRLEYIAEEEDIKIPGLKEMVEGIELYINSRRTDYFHRSIQKIED